VKPKKILLVEDEAILALAEAQQIAKYGFEVKTAYTGEKAIEIIGDDPDISLVLMDIDLGRGMDGTGTARKILEHHDLPIVFLSSHTEPEVVEKTEGISSYGYIVKNSGETVLIASIKMAFRLHKAHTELTIQEERLLASEENLRITLNSIGDAVISTDTSGKVVSMNRVAEQLCGWRREEAEGKPLEKIFRIVNAGTGLSVENPVSRVLATGTIIGLANHTKLIAGNGNEYQIADSAAPIRDKEGTINGVVLVFRDVTGEYEKEQELRESELRYRNLFENAPVGIFQTDSAGHALHVNPTMAAMVGAKDAEDAIANFHDLATQLYVHPERRQEFLDELQKNGLVRNFEYEARQENGRLRWFSMNARTSSRLPEDGFLIDGFTTDITERKEAETALKEAEWKFRALFEKGPIGVAYHRIIRDDSGRAVDYLFLDANERYRELTGVDPRGKTVLEAFSGIENDPFDWIGTFGELARTGEEIRFEQFLQPNGRWYDVVGYRYMPDHFVAAFLEITDRKELAHLIRENEKRLNLALEGTRAGLWDWDMIHNRVIFSETWKNMLGYSDSEVENSFEGWKRLWHPEDTAEIEKALEDHLAGRTRNYEIIHRLRHKDGSWRWIMTRGGILRDDTGQPYRWIGTNLDISESKKNESALEKALEEKKHLMQELNHRIKNNLSIVSSFISLKEDEEKSDFSDLKHRINAIRIIHEKLYRSEDVSVIRIQEYLTDLLESIFSTFSRQKVSIEVAAGDLHLTTKTAVPLGLIVNELATNAIKYGFTAGEPPHFSAILSAEKETGNYLLEVSNSGAPFPEDKGLENPKTLGLKLVTTLASQLNGTVELQKKPRPLFTISFPGE
jgi:PAS domain S-box-containing protein